MMTPQVCLLTKDQVSQNWDKIEWRIDATPPLQRFFTKDDIINQVCKDEAQLWTAGSDLVLLTQVIESPLGKIFQIVWAHGTGLEHYWEELKEKFHTFALMTECKKIEVLGRLGWAKRFRDEEGFKIEYVAYTCDVKRPRMN
jgi:hypothetical protein